MRRDIHFSNLEEIIPECKSLLTTGYIRYGNWSLGQICCHLRLTITANLNGYPTWMMVFGYTLRPLLRMFLLPRLLRGNSPSGIRTAGMFVPGFDIDDRQQVEHFKACIDQFIAHKGWLHAHPGFGNMTKDEFAQFHAAHAAHHLSFLAPDEKNRNDKR